MVHDSANKQVWYWCMLHVTFLLADSPLFIYHKWPQDEARICWFRDVAAPWKADWAVAELGFTSKLSIAAVLKSSCLRFTHSNNFLTLFYYLIFPYRYVSILVGALGTIPSRLLGYLQAIGVPEVIGCFQTSALLGTQRILRNTMAVWFFYMLIII